MESASLPLRSLLLSGLCAVVMDGYAADNVRLELAATITMAAVKGRIDHFAVDVKGHRLFIAGLGNGSVEVLDTQANTHLKSISGFSEPQGLVYLPQSNRLYVANGEGNRVDVLDAGSLVPVKRMEELEDADNVRYDGATGTVIVGYGKGALRLLNADTSEPVGDIRLSGHPESFQLETAGKRAFVNVPTAQHVAIVDRTKRKVVATWEVSKAARNFPMALDEKAGRLFVGARSPAIMLVYDTGSGNIVARVPIGGDTDDLFVDAVRKRIYVICGEGRVDVVRQETADRYTHEGSVETAPRARTGLYVPESDTLYIAAPADGSSPARVLVYRVK